MVQFRADWIVPVSEPPFRDGWVSIEQGRIAGVSRRGPLAHPRGRHQDLGAVALLPGLINAHVHLELSYLRDEIRPASTFTSWIRQVMGRRREHPDPASPVILEGVHAGIREAVASGTALVGDISNTLVTVAPLVESALAGVVFYELIRFGGQDAEHFVNEGARRIDALPPSDRVRVSLAAHAPYSVGPQVFRAIREQLGRRPSLPASVHLAESVEEVEFLREGTGAWRAFLEEVGAWDDTWRTPGVTPVRYLEEHGFLFPGLLAVHGVQMAADDLARLARHGATLVTCPRSNERTGAGIPPIADFYASGVRVAVGTDSLASTPDLNVFAELEALRRRAPGVPARALLDSATRQGARALGFEAEFGTIEPGKRARVLAVGIPRGTADVEEYLVSGILPEQVRWIQDIED